MRRLERREIVEARRLECRDLSEVRRLGRRICGRVEPARRLSYAASNNAW